MNHDGFTKPDNYIEKICKRLQYKIDNICDIYHVPKPKRMRQYTYERLIKELRHWQRMRNIAFVVGSDKILKRGGWVDGR
jgi:nicotinic acid mononucleotide adenylyltransferase